MYTTAPEIGAHERTHTEAFFRKVKFWDEMSQSKEGKVSKNGSSGTGSSSGGDSNGHIKQDPPPVFIMPDGLSYLHVNRNGLIFGCATAKNVSPCMVIEVRFFALHYRCVICKYDSLTFTITHDTYTT